MFDESYRMKTDPNKLELIKETLSFFIKTKT
jgi:hypothetical protein